MTMAFTMPRPGEATRHYAPNGNFDRSGHFLPAGAGFDIADVSDPGELKALPEGTEALVWVGLCEGATPRFVAKVRPFLGNAKVFGFYLMDDPDPRPALVGSSSAKRCEPAKLREESDWLHENAPGARTMIVLMNLRKSRHPFYDRSYAPENSHVDLFGMSAYPCRSEWEGCDYAAIDRYLAAVKASGVREDQVVPVYQAFGGGGWTDDEGGRYLLPTPEQGKEIIRRWRRLLPNPVLDMAYSWGSQKGDNALQSSPALQEVFRAYNQRSWDLP
jgi:hypothetical protein